MGGRFVWLFSKDKPLAFVSALQEILNYISRREFEPLLRVDQLNLEREKHKVFLRFSECSLWSWGMEDAWVFGAVDFTYPLLSR